MGNLIRSKDRRKDDPAAHPVGRCRVQSEQLGAEGEEGREEVGFRKRITASVDIRPLSPPLPLPLRVIVALLADNSHERK